MKATSAKPRSTYSPNDSLLTKPESMLLISDRHLIVSDEVDVYEARA